ncbi:hypothetical protein K461DRAFT_77124 [Myriangium duriaei CBS 260.36]|uniref:Uncharacterized protein n=1 Tax=Myriangium duriaei CBS 260.36 TaxID=1168546 RepID=A0A9P4J662_9PEZI|nr:hypothetical protein K461DRAFT_77124 [Myriangium duriaei CBS 260.36]
MGGRLSMPKGPAGTTEISHPRTSPYPRSRVLNSRHIVAPAAAFTMACLLFVYTRTSIRAAKTNAQRHRDADSGGEGLNLLAESRRRHGLSDKVEHGGTVRQLGEQLVGKKGKTERGKVEGDEAEEKLRAAMGRRKE